jgi:hypothetical protein
MIFRHGTAEEAPESTNKALFIQKTVQKGVYQCPPKSIHAQGKPVENAQVSLCFMLGPQARREMIFVYALETHSDPQHPYPPFSGPVTVMVSMSWR